MARLEISGVMMNGNWDDFGRIAVSTMGHSSSPFEQRIHVRIYSLRGVPHSFVCQPESMYRIVICVEIGLKRSMKPE